MRTVMLLGVFVSFAAAACSVDEAAAPNAQRVSAVKKAIVGEPCASSEACNQEEGEYCTTEDGECNRPPGCGPDDVCPAVCYGTCRGGVVACGPSQCGRGLYCCNESCGHCAPLDGFCTMEACYFPVGEQCGSRVCGPGQYCCNPSCGICAPFPDGVCIDLYCGDPV